jgi:hypothetical protein
MQNVIISLFSCSVVVVKGVLRNINRKPFIENYKKIHRWMKLDYIEDTQKEKGYNFSLQNYY